MAALLPAPRGPFDRRQLAIGTRIEMEHTRIRSVAATIAKHHLDEFPDYYRELPKMERRLAQRLPRAIANVSFEEDGMTIWGVLSVASAGASAYHGYKRNESVGWALWWGICGAALPVITPAIAFAQGFGKPAQG
jgi:hypothetical protein